jgi:cholesterol transport system auxiliary component
MCNSKLFQYAVFLLVMFTAVSCAPKKQALERNHYLLETSRQGPAAMETAAGALGVRDFSVSPGYQGRGIIYRTGKNIIRADFYNHYFVLPGPMIAQLSEAWIRESGLFASVIPLSSHKEADYLLEGAVKSLYADLQNPDQPRAVAEINFLLLKNTEVRFEMAFQKKYRSETEMKGPGPDYFIEALNKGLAEILSALEEDMAAAVARSQARINLQEN